jgi:xanthine dehydrogenase molybdenum-binding subunit
MAKIELNLNGADRVAEVEDGASLLELLRDGFGLISPKDGCSPQGQCGCCTVIVDDRAVVSCAVPAAKTAGKRVLTLEGFSELERETFAESFIAGGGLQCGFCTPGIIVRAKNLLDKEPEPTDDQINRILSMHHCRCTGYVKIVDSIKLAACSLRNGNGNGHCAADSNSSAAQETAQVHDARPPASPAARLDTATRTNGAGIGTNAPRYEARELALGDRPYVDDMTFAGMLHGAVLLSEHPRALVKSIDTSRAREIDGVVAIVTAADSPGKRHQGLIYDDWPIFVSEGEETRCRN